MTKEEQTQSWADEANSPAKKVDIPDGLWMRCDVCSTILFKRSVQNNLWVCPDCQHHFRVDATQRIVQLVDPETFDGFDENLESLDPLHFVDLKAYPDRLAAAQKKTNVKERYLETS